MAKRKTIGENPLDAVIPHAEDTENTDTEEPTRTKSANAQRKPTKVAKQRLTVHVPVDLIDRVRNAVYWTPGLTLARLAEVAFTEAVEQMEAERGEAFPAREQELTGGRPMK